MPASPFTTLPVDAALSQTATASTVVRASEEGGEAAINPWFVGGFVLLLLLLLLGAVMVIGGGRDHS